MKKASEAESRVSHPAASKEGASGKQPSVAQDPGGNRSPKSPLKAAGTRIDPPVSVPKAMGTRFRPTVHALPLLDPPDMRDGSRG